MNFLTFAHDIAILTRKKYFERKVIIVYSCKMQLVCLLEDFTCEKRLSQIVKLNATDIFCIYLHSKKKKRIPTMQ